MWSKVRPVPLAPPHQASCSNWDQAEPGSYQSTVGMPLLSKAPLARAAEPSVSRIAVTASSRQRSTRSAFGSEPRTDSGMTFGQSFTVMKSMPPTQS